MSLLSLLYQALIHLLLLPGLLFWGIAALGSKRWREGWRERLGGWEPTPHGAVWIHGASMGEMRALAPLVRAMKEAGTPLLLTATSPTGRAEAANLLGSGVGWVRMLPLDFFWAVAGAFRASRPSALVLAETEIWPGLLRRAQVAKVPVFLVSARLSERAFPRYRAIRFLLRPLLRLYAVIQAQSPRDAERFAALGADPARLSVAGNLKFDVEPPPAEDANALRLDEARRAGWRVLVGGSTHEGEESAVLEAAGALKRAGVRVGVVLAPRHLSRLEAAERAAREARWPPVRWSALAGENAVTAAFERGETLVVDGYGILGNLYGGADAAFVGGSLVPVGGHNLLEPLRFGVPVFFGPHMENAADVRDEVARRNLGREVADGAAMGRELQALFADPVRERTVRDEAASFFADNRGAVAAALSVIEAARAGGGR